jgi:hypothetical protein
LRLEPEELLTLLPICGLDHIQDLFSALYRQRNNLGSSQL